MGKKNKTIHQNQGRCIYTGRMADSKDHVPPKCVLPEPYTSNLITVPSCAKFNHEMSFDEQYFIAVISQVIPHPSILQRLSEGGNIDRALSRRNFSLDEKIAGQLGVSNDGQPYIEPDMQRINLVLEKIAAGLYFIEYGHAPGLEHFKALSLFPWQNPPLDMIELSWSMQAYQEAKVVDWSAFIYGFSWSNLHPQHRLCNMNFYNTLFGMVLCPVPTRDISSPDS